MEEGREGVREAVLEELARLGVQKATLKKAHPGSRFLHATVSSSSSSSSASSSSSKSGKAKAKGKRSPGRGAAGKSPLKVREERKNTPKSPFASAKRRAEARRLNAAAAAAGGKENKSKVFGQALDQAAQVEVYLNCAGGEEKVRVPELMVDLCTHIRRNITTEGIFRKAGSAHRQTELKKLLDAGDALPSSVHVIDCACLLKQYLRCLPEPLLLPEVHGKMVACMKLEAEARVDAVALCILLFPRSHIHALLYLLDFFSEVVGASSSNKMDAKNLAIVLAPTLPPPAAALHRKSSSFPHSSSPPEDAMLTTNVEILQLLIENAATVCRMPTYVMETLEPRHRSQSTENLNDGAAPPLPPSTTSQTQQQPNNTKKKRRSASIHRFMTGFRRVVGHSRPEPASPMDEPNSLDLYPGVALSPITSMGNPTPRKRKSADANILGVAGFREKAELLQASPPTCKKVKLEDDDATAAAIAKPPSAPSSILCLHTASSVRRTDGVGEPKVPGAASSTEDVPSKSLWANLHHNVPTSSSSRGRRSVDSLYPATTFTPFHPLHKAQSHLSAMPSPLLAPSTPYQKRRSFDLPLSSGGVKRANTFEAGGPATRRRSSIKSLNEPDGAAMWTPEPRGVPDGAECTLRHQPSTSLQALEEQYDSIKNVVRREEERLEQSAVQHMTASLFPNMSTSTASQNLSCSEMIQNAYERMREETEGQLGTPGPSDTLSRRLNRELKIRNRRSGEHPVIRSPSERRIGTIRRRSKESVQNTAKSLINPEEVATPAPAPPAFLYTPKMKATLLSTPASASLRRGRPNSVKSGLPMVVRPSDSHSPGLQSEDTTPGHNSSRLVVVSRRAEEGSASKVKSTKKAREKQPLFSTRKQSGGIGASPSYHQPSHGAADRSAATTITAMESEPSGGENLDSSFLEEVMGPMTRRQSRRLSLASSIPKLKLSPSPSQASEPSLDEEWVCAPDYLKAEVGECGEGMVGRPSLAALVKQKKVRAAVQLFNNLRPASPFMSSSSVADQQRSKAARLTPRSSMTSRDLLKVRGPLGHSPARVAIVAPLRESSLVNIPPQPHRTKTPQRCSSLPLHQDYGNPPKLPPRGAIKPSPGRVKYR